jgi:hypothetical protein
LGRLSFKKGGVFEGASLNSFSAFFIDKKDGSLNGRSYALAYFVLAHVFFWKLLVPGQVLFGTDIMTQSYPIQHMAVREMLQNRSLMLWNPYIFSGMPFLASFSFPFFYPLAILFFILPLGFAMGYEVLLHFFLMGLFMYVFLRHLKLARPAAFVGGLLFMFNAHLISLVYPGHGGKLFTMTYLPLAMMFLDRAMDERPLYNLTLMGLMVGLMFYGGHIQILFYCGIALLGFFLMRLISGLKGRGIAWGAKAAAGFACAFALGIMLYAVILFPAWEYRGYTGRAGGVTGASTYQFATSFSEPPEDLTEPCLRRQAIQLVHGLVSSGLVEQDCSSALWRRTIVKAGPHGPTRNAVSLALLHWAQGLAGRGRSTPARKRQPSDRLQLFTRSATELPR